MGFKNGKVIKRVGFKPLGLTESNVEAIFSRCLATSDTEDAVSALIFSALTSFKESEVKILSFDKSIVLSNYKSIEYLYGQLKVVHLPDPINQIPITDFAVTYSERLWTSYKSILIKLLYLQAIKDLRLMDIFEAENKTTAFIKTIKPTLSPQDPAFPAWWEAHKAEWEQ